MVWIPPGWNRERKDAKVCGECPNVLSTCLLRGLPAQVQELHYNLVFLLETPDDGAFGDIPVAPRVEPLLDAVMERAGSFGSSPPRYSVLYASGMPQRKGAPPVAVVDRCSEYVREKLCGLESALRGVRPEAAQSVIVAFGPGAMRALGFKTANLKKIRGTALTTRAGQHTFRVIPTVALRQLFAAPGYLETAGADVALAIRTLFSAYAPSPLEVICKDYVYPQTGTQLRELVDYVLRYTGDAKIAPPDWPIALDFETNTLSMHAPHAKAIMLSVAWELGKAAAWPLDHRDTTLDADFAMAQALRLLLSTKRKIWHHGKFDLSVRQCIGRMMAQDPHRRDRILAHVPEEYHEGLRRDPQRMLSEPCGFWLDTLTAQHFLNEAGQGTMSLKALTYVYTPTMAGYESQLQDALLKTQRGGLDQAAQLVTYASAHDRGIRFPESKQDVHALEAEYVRVVMERALSKPQSDERAELSKRRDSLRGKILTRYKYVDADPPDPASIDVRTALEDAGTYEDIPLEVLLPYAAIDTDVTRQVCQRQHDAARKQTRDFDDGSNTLGAMHNLMRTIAVPGIHVLGRMEYRGIKVNPDLLEQYEREAAALQDKTRERMFNLAAREFNPNSAQQLEQVLTQVFDVDPGDLSRTESGQLATSEDVMEALARKYPATAADLFVHLLLTYRNATKAASTYLFNLRQAIELDGRIHYSAGMETTVTGRLSISRPSMQNLPAMLCARRWSVLGAAARSRATLDMNPDGSFRRVLRIGPELFVLPDGPDTDVVVLESLAGLSVKRLLIPDDGCAMFSGDINSAEIRILCAKLGEDDPLTRAMQAGLNAPSYVTSKVFRDRILDAYMRPMGVEIPQDDDSAEKLVYAFVEANKDTIREIGMWRTAAKRILYGIVYGAGDKTCAEQVYGMLAEEGSPLYEEQLSFIKTVRQGLYTLSPGLPRYIAEAERQATIYGRVQAFTWRYRRGPLRHLGNFEGAKFRRDATNFMIQAPASDLVLVAMAAMERDLYDLGGTTLFPVHDAIVGQIPLAHLDKLGGLFDRHVIEGTRASFPWLPMDYVYDLGVGPNYKDMVPYQGLMNGTLQPKHQALVQGWGLTPKEMP